MPENTIGFTSLYPGSISFAGADECVMVSPIVMSETSFTLETM